MIKPYNIVIINTTLFCLMTSLEEITIVLTVEIPMCENMCYKACGEKKSSHGILINKGLLPCFNVDCIDDYDKLYIDVIKYIKDYMGLLDEDMELELATKTACFVKINESYIFIIDVSHVVIDYDITSVFDIISLNSLKIMPNILDHCKATTAIFKRNRFVNLTTHTSKILKNIIMENLV